MNTAEVNNPSSSALPSKNNIPQTVNSCVNEHELELIYRKKMQSWFIAFYVSSASIGQVVYQPQISNQ